jgi:hypothetical protein
MFTIPDAAREARDVSEAGMSCELKTSQNMPNLVEFKLGRACSGTDGPSSNIGPAFTAGPHCASPSRVTDLGSTRASCDQLGTALLVQHGIDGGSH